MKRPLLTLTTILICAMAIPLSACKGEEEKARSTALNFVEADAVLAAPYRSYLFITRADQAAMSADDYASWHSSEPRDVDGELTVNSLSLEAPWGSAEVRLGAEAQRLVLLREDGRWRVHLGLEHVVPMRRHIDAARAALKEGKPGAALEEIEQADAIVFKGTLYEAMNRDVQALKVEADALELSEEIESAITRGKSAGLDELERLVPELEKMIERRGALDEPSQRDREAVDALRGRQTELRGEAALDGLRLTESAIRRFYEGNAIVYELDATVENGSTVPVSEAQLSLTMLQRGNPLGTREMAFSFAEPLAAGAARPVSVRIPKGPVEWKSREFESEFIEVEIVNE